MKLVVYFTVETRGVPPLLLLLAAIEGAPPPPLSPPTFRNRPNAATVVRPTDNAPAAIPFWHSPIAANKISFSPLPDNSLSAPGSRLPN